MISILDSYKIIVVCLLTVSVSSSNFTKSTFPKIKPADWPHKSVFVQAGSGMNVIGMGKNRPVPLGVPFDIESPLFNGTILLRFRNAKSDDPESHDE